MRKKGTFLRAVCIAAALSMSVVETPAVSVVSFAAVSGEETPEADTEVEDNSQETEEAAEAVSGDAEEAADQKETGDVTEDDDTGDKAETGTEILEETESGSEGKEEAEADTGTEKETEAEIETEEETKEETQGETEISEESRSQEEEPSEHEEIQETDALTEDETAPDPTEGEMKQETEGTEIQDGIVSAEVELNPDQVEAGTTILNEFGVTFPWPAAGTTVAKAKAQISLDSFTNKDQIKSWSVSFRDGGTVLADKATFVKGKTYSCRTEIRICN